MTGEGIKKVAVLGSGIMGSGIAAHLASAGIPSYLLDIVPKDAGGDRNKLAKAGIENILKAKPSLIYSKKDARLITPGNFEDDWGKLAECDWIIEVVVEKLEIKRQVFERVEKVIRPGTIVTSNTSGLSLTAMAEGRGAEFRRHFLITHFFNPVRYMKLVEVVSAPETDPKTVARVVNLLEERLGKGVVYAKNTPSFVANRIGVYNWVSTLQTILQEGYQVGEVDKILGAAIGRPKSGMFRTSDMVGLDTLVHVAQHTYEYCSRDEKREAHRIPAPVEKMLEKKMLGEKTGQGFYKKIKKEDGGSEIFQLNLKTLDYEPQPKFRYESLSATKNIDDVSKRIRFLVDQKDRAASLAWKSVRDMLLYSAHRIPEIADDVVNIDNAMKWGFNWSLGPFETWDALGVQKVVERLKSENLPTPPLVQKVLTKGIGSFYKTESGRRYFFDLKTESYLPVPDRPGILILKSVKEQTEVILKNDSASLIDVGDGVACLEFHSKMNAIDGEIIHLMNDAVARVEKDFSGLVLYNEGENFSVGANLMLLFLAAQSEDWGQIEEVVKSFQQACMRLRYSAKPVVAAPFNLALGGGCEVSLGADQIVAHGELYMGLVEVGVGLIPAGGGCKEMIRRFDESLKTGPFAKVQKAFETIAFASVSTSAKEAQEIGYLTKKDVVTPSRDHLLGEAKKKVIEMSRSYQRPEPRRDILLPGRGGYYALLSAIEGFRLQGKITDHDQVIGEKLAHILTGGDMPNLGYVSEQRLLDLEREVFLSLVGMEKTQARIQNMLLTGKPLRN
ncbi:MAG: 3-hydroxyacyl-CoA dehydrogenase/enoyl-CoA hydratase family protein [Deltaproteobacteria bacterium]|nr:3-hydroxyacyl-CoA dehydrogenase/enoyl-CoA hydratase family protein [Deltaproteobacteria bacterium]